MENRVELCCHTKMSKLQGINSAKEYIEEAIKRGYKQIAITDTNSTQALLEASDYLKLYTSNDNFKVIYGTEMILKEGQSDDKKYSIYIYVKEQKGLKNLYRLISKAWTHKDYEQPIIYREELEKYREGLLFSAIGKNSEVYQVIEELSFSVIGQKIDEKSENYKSIISNIMSFYDFIGIEPNNSNQIINQKIYETCIENNKTLIGTAECNFIHKEDAICNEILNFYKKSSNIKEGNNNYFQSAEELIEKFNYLKNAKEIVIDNPIKIAKQIEEIDVETTEPKLPTIMFAYKRIVQECYNKAHKIYGAKLPKEIEERLEKELEYISKNEYQSIFIIYRDIVKKSKELGYKTGSRGSVGCSLVAYLLGITNIDPIQYKLPFEILVGKNYDREQDIDLNFSDRVRDKLFEYLQGKFGKDKVIWGGTIGTLSERTIEKCANEHLETIELENYKNKEEIQSKLSGIKNKTGEHPGGVFILPEEQDMLDYCPTEIGNRGHLKTHNDYHSIWDRGLYKFDLISNDNLTMLYELEKATKTNSNDIDLEDKTTIELIAKNKTNGIPEFGTSFVKDMIEKAKPQSFNDLVCISDLAHGTGTWTHNASTLIEEGKSINELITSREEMYNYLIKNGIEKEIAFDIVEFIRKGKAQTTRSLWSLLKEKHLENVEKWNEYKNIMKKHNIPEWYIQSAEKIRYLFQKSHAIDSTEKALKIAWYKAHYPKAFYNVYFKTKSDLNIKDYYCIRQIKTELRILKDKKERHEIDNSYSYDYNNELKINDLEVLLEMFELGIIKEKGEIKDDYNLINSRVICDYCRSIKHKFNTEELAVLVFRNKRMSIDEKIEKYNDLIINYPDMEVIKRINCNHYDSVKTMVKNEIKRLERLRKKLIQKDEDCLYVWTEFNKSTKRIDYSSDLEHTYKTFQEAYKNIQNYIKEFDDTISFRITKKYFNKRKRMIYADYNVVNKKSKLINITEEGHDFLDIDQIFLNIPTPFEKGDILMQTSRGWRNYGDCEDTFVLDYLCTWKEDLESWLADGNYDSSDMIGYGYYLYGEDSTKFVNDNKWDYDSFEYYEGELKGRNRILKGISSLIKGKIELELFVNAYNYYQNREIGRSWYTYKGLKLAGLSDEEIKEKGDN